jgi:hypothetical protein
MNVFATTAILVQDSDSADIFLFLDGHQHYRDIKLNAIRQHPLVRRDPAKAFLYSELDQPWCAMPGLYVAMPKASFDLTRQRACAYLSAPNQQVRAAAFPTARADLLFSFMGRDGNSARERVLALKSPDAFIQDTSAMNFFGTDTASLDQQRRQYADIIARSRFVLCPRGAGPSSYRIFETMAAGRVPVILSDSWVPPRGPAWDQCALIINESDIGALPRILRDHAPRFETMASAARCEWETWFAGDVLFHRMIDDLADLIRSRGPARIPFSRPFDPRYLRLRARAAKSGVLESLGHLLRPSESPQPKGAQ